MHPRIDRQDIEQAHAIETWYICVVQLADVEAARRTFEDALPRVTAPLSVMGIADRNKMVGEFDRAIVDGIQALYEISALRVPLDLVECGVEHGVEHGTESARALLDQARRLSDVVQDVTAALRERVRSLVSHRIGDFQRASRAAMDNLADYRAALALVLSDDDELDDLGWTPPPEPPPGTGGPMTPLDEARRGFAR